MTRCRTRSKERGCLTRGGGAVWLPSPDPQPPLLDSPALHAQALTVKSAIPHPRIMGIIRECGGKMHMHDELWSEAATDFFEVCAWACVYGLGVALALNPCSIRLCIGTSSRHRRVVCDMPGLAGVRGRFLAHAHKASAPCLGIITITQPCPCRTCSRTRPDLFHPHSPATPNPPTSLLAPPPHTLTCCCPGVQGVRRGGCGAACAVPQVPGAGQHAHGEPRGPLRRPGGM